MDTFTIEVSASAAREIEDVRPFEQRRIVGNIKRSLTVEPVRPSRNRKRLEGVAPGFDHVPPLWQLRVGDYRVFYDVDAHRRIVTIRAVRLKGKRTTEDIV